MNDEMTITIIQPIEVNVTESNLDSSTVTTFNVFWMYSKCIFNSLFKTIFSKFHYHCWENNENHTISYKSREKLNFDCKQMAFRNLS